MTWDYLLVPTMITDEKLYIISNNLTNKFYYSMIGINRTDPDIKSNLIVYLKQLYCVISL